MVKMLLDQYGADGTLTSDVRAVILCVIAAFQTLQCNKRGTQEKGDGFNLIGKRAK